MNHADEPVSGGRSPWRPFALLGFVLLIALLSVARRGPLDAAPKGAQSADGVWQDVAEAALRPSGERMIQPAAYRTISLDWTALNSLLGDAPDALNLANTEAPGVILTLPLPDGSFGRFQIYQTAVMHRDLAAKFPEIKTYAGVGLDDPTAYARLDTTPKGFHGMILSANGRIFIDPYSTEGIDLYQSYLASDFIPNLPDDFDPDVVVEPEADSMENPPAAAGALSSGGELRTYRLAVAATGEYTQFHGGTVNLAMAEITTAINRVAGIYEREVAVTFELVANNNLVVYTDGTTDPYTNNDGADMLAENQSNLDNIIGSANYDIGHVFSTGGGGIAGLGVVCGSTKAWGVTGRAAPIGDPFYVDYVSHEIGHQFAGNHTFNGNAGFCAGSQRNGATAYEPGSATTIMGYAGICSPQNIQSNSDDYFHGGSFDEIVSFTSQGLGSTCGATSSTGNTPPTVDAGSSYSIPLNTPFTLTGSATDPDGSAGLTYSWEEFDLGPTGHPNSPVDDAPIFRSFPAISSPSRTFPRISDIVNNAQTLGEILPSYGRTMNFRLTVRDNQTPAGGVGHDATTVTAVSGTGPFLVTAPNTAVTWTGNSNETVTWNVANTNLAPISCASVVLTLSTDGGFTYSTVLSAATPNDGSASVQVPNISTSSARLRVACANNIFFDISNTNFTIQPGAPGDSSLTVNKSVAPSDSVTPGDSLTYTITISNEGTGTAANTTVTDNFDSALVNPVCNGIPGNLWDTVVINSEGSVSYTCTAQVDPSLALAISHTAVPQEIMSGEEVTYTISVSNSHGSLSLGNVQVSAPNVTGCTPALNNPLTLGPGASQTYTCPNNQVNLPTSSLATVSGDLTVSNVAMASDPGDPGSPASSSTVQTQVVVSASDSVTVVLSDWLYFYLPLVAR